VAALLLYLGALLFSFRQDRILPFFRSGWAGIGCFQNANNVVNLITLPIHLPGLPVHSPKQVG